MGAGSRVSIIADIHRDLEQGAVRLITENRDSLMAEATRLCGDAATAEDLVMRTFFKAIKNIDQHKADESLIAWMKAILRNLYLNDQRKPVARGTTPVDPEVMAADESLATNESEEQILRDSDHDALREAVERLPPIYRDSVVLHYFEEFSIKDIAIALNAPQGTIFRRLNVARKLLAKDLAVKLGKKKPLAILVAAILGVGVLFGAWQAGLGEWIENTLSSAGESAESSETISNQQEIQPMHKLKRITLATAVAASAMSLTAPADIVLGEKTDTDYGWTRTYTDNGKEYVVEAYTDTSKTWDFPVPTGVSRIDYLVVAGGGSGGRGNYAGGGGAGGMLEGYGAPISSKTLSVTVGKGGAVPSSNGQGNNGDNSSILDGATEIACAIGGGGGGGSNSDGSLGGSGGGAGGESGGKTGGSGTDGQGFAGASTTSTSGGGGGGGAGDNAPTPTVKGSWYTQFNEGGPGKESSITGENVSYAHGGRSSAGPNCAREIKWTTPGCGANGFAQNSVDQVPEYVLPGCDGIVVIRYAKASSVNLKVMPSEGTQVSLNGGEFVGAIDEAVYSDSPITLLAKGESDAFDFEWANLPEGAQVSPDKKTVTFDMPESDWTITVTGKATTLWKLDVSATEGGTIGGDASGSYPDGAAITLTATSNEAENYKFVGWFIGDDLEATENPYSFELKGDTAIEARFEKKAKYALTIVSSEHGTITGNDGTEYYEGTKVTLTATPNEGLVFVGWGDDAAPFGKATEITLTMDAAKTVSAKFGYTLTITPSEYGAIVPEPNGTVFEAGATVMLTATPNENCEFLSWQGDVTGDGATTTVTMDQDRTVAALYKDNKGRAHYEWGWKGEVKNDKGRVTGYIVAYEKPGKYDLEVPKGSTIDYLVVAGGGSGGYAMYAGGGGAGGMLEAYGVPVSSRTLSITVGRGGAVQGALGQKGNNGENSSISNGVTEIALALGGGGGGGNGNNKVGNHGGSGGGAGGEGGAAAGGTGEDGQGFNGATSLASGPGGGGGAGGAAPEVINDVYHVGSYGLNAGGPGKESTITGESVTYACGGYSAQGAICATADKIKTEAGSGANGFGNNSDASLRKPGRDGIVVIRYAARPKGLAIMFY